MYPNFFCNFFLPNILFSIFHVFKRIHWLKLNCLHMHECGVICWVMSNLLVIFLKRKNDSPSNSSWWCRRLLNQGWDFISSSHMSAEISRDSLLCKSREGFLSFFEYNSHTMSRKQHFATLSVSFHSWVLSGPFHDVHWALVMRERREYRCSF